MDASVELQNERHGANRQIQRIWDFTKIGEFDTDSWTKILEYLSNDELANASLVCRDFQNITETIFAKRYANRCIRTFVVDFDTDDWMPIVCRFGHVISSVVVIKAENSDVLKKEDFAFFEQYLSDSVKKIHFREINISLWYEIVITRKFTQLEELLFQTCDLRGRSAFLQNFHHWYPNLKFLHLPNCLLSKAAFIEQSMPRLINFGFPNLTIENVDSLMVFLIKNRQLKHLSVNSHSCNMGDYTNTSILPILNEISINLETLVWGFTHFRNLPTFRQNFNNIKKLSFPLSFADPSTTYKNELLKIIHFFPILETLNIVIVPRNLMTNDDLIDLLTHGSSTLKEFCVTARGSDMHLQLGYDLHRRIREATSNRSHILIEFEFGFGQFRDRNSMKKVEITKNSILLNGKLIVLKASNE